MSASVYIMAHGGAQKTVDDFLPKWKALDARIVCSLPEGDSVDGFDEYFFGGASAYRGQECFRRFVLTLEHAISAGAEHITIAEYDTVPLRPVLPIIYPGRVSAFFVFDDSINWRNQMQLCALSPWSFDLETGKKLLKACQRGLETDPEHEEGDGLLDRWVGGVIHKSQIPEVTAPDLLGYPWREGTHERIASCGFNWIHGWKTKEDFGELWNQN